MSSGHPVSAHLGSSHSVPLSLVLLLPTLFTAFRPCPALCLCGGAHASFEMMHLCWAREDESGMVNHKDAIPTANIIMPQGEGGTSGMRGKLGTTPCTPS